MNLYRLELIKIKPSVYRRTFAGIFAGLLTIGILFLFISRIEAGSAVPEEADMFADWNGLLALTTALSFSCFSVFAAVTAAKVIVDEYCSDKAVLLLCYPVERTALLEAKCLLVCKITIVSASVSNVLVMGAMYLTARIFGIMPQIHTEHFVLTVLISSILMGVLSSSVGVISAVWGWKKYSAAAAIVCSVILVCAAANFIAVYPDMIIGSLLIMCVFFTMAAGFSCRILASGIEKMEV